MNNLIGKRIEHYQIEALLGEGGMGSVYRALDLKEGRLVALKIMHTHLSSKPQFQRRFSQEAQATVNFNSPSIIKTFDSDTYENTPYVIMEYVPGGSLTAYLKQLQWAGRHITLEEVVGLGAQIAEGLAYAHQRGVIHRDIKPDNILLREVNGSGQHAVITDFGLAILLKGREEVSTNPFMGSLPYMSPEQCANQPLDGRSDIYSLGIMMYQLATGQLPFKIESPADVIKHLQESPLPPRLLNPDLPAQLEEIILKMLAKKPSERYQTGAELALALRQVDLTEAAANTIMPGVGQQIITKWVEDRWIAKVDVRNRIDARKTWTGEGNYRLLIAHQWEEGRLESLTKEQVTIGRLLGNDIVLDDHSVSGQHVRMELSDNGWLVEDLGTTNGTHLDQVALEFGKPLIWGQEQTLHIGPYSMQWQAFQEAHRGAISNLPPGRKTAAAASAAGIAAAAALMGTAASPSASAGTAAPQIDLPLPPPEFSGEGNLGLSIQPPDIRVEPGKEATIQVTVANQGVTVEDVVIRLEENGMPISWVTLPQYALKLMPDESQTVAMAVSPPQDSSINAGGHTYQLIATTTRGESESIRGRIDVAPWEDFALDMHPSNLQEQITCRVSIKNESNFENTFHVVGIDDSDALEFEFGTPQNAILVDQIDLGAEGDQAIQGQTLRIKPGSESKVSYTVGPKKRPWFRAPTTPFFFNIRVRTELSEWQELSGQLEVQPRISRRVLIFFIVLLAIIGLLAFYSYKQIKADSDARLQEAQSTAQAIQATADAIRQTAEAAQSEAEGASSEASAAQATADAVRASLGEEAAAEFQATADALQATADAAAAAAAAAEAAAAGAEGQLADAQAAAADAAAGANATPVPPPSDITLDKSSITENNSVGAVIGNFIVVPGSAMAPGSGIAIAAAPAPLPSASKTPKPVSGTNFKPNLQTGIKFTLELVSGSGDDDNSAFYIDGLALKAAERFDFETKKSYSVRVSADNGFGGTFEKGFTITVDDVSDTPALSVADATAQEDDGSVTILVSMSNNSNSDVSVDYTTEDDTAEAGVNYRTEAGTLTWKAGETGAKEFDVTIIDNKADDPDSTFKIKLSDPIIGVISDGTAIVSILDDDSPPTLRISNAAGDEDDGTVNVIVTMSGESTEDVTVNFSTSDGTARAGTDYTAVTNGKLTWAAGQTGDMNIPIVMTSDDLYELDETLNVSLSSPVNATFDNSSAIVTITNDDPKPSLVVSDVEITEGAGDAKVTVTMTGKSSLDVNVNYATTDGTAREVDGDYKAASGTLTWKAGETGPLTFLVTVLTDGVDEPSGQETINITLSAPVNATITDGTGTIKITDIDPTPTLSISGNSFAEPAATGASSSGTVLSVVMTGKSSANVTANYSTADGTAKAGSDYTAITNGTITWPAGTTGPLSIPVVILGDAIFEPTAETFKLTLTSATNATISTTPNPNPATISITDSDSEPQLVIETVAPVTEGNSGTKNATISVRMIGGSAANVVVSYNVSGGTATKDVDFVDKTGQLTWTEAEANTTKDVTVVVNGDTIDEKPGNPGVDYETIEMTFSVNPGTAAWSGSNVATIQIDDDDAPPVLEVQNTPILFDEAGGDGDRPVTVILRGGSDRPVVVNPTTTDGTASSPQDFTALGPNNAQEFTFPLNQQDVSHDFNIFIKDDTIYEPENETFKITLDANFSSSGVADVTFDAAIASDDPVPQLTVLNTPISVTEGVATVTVTVRMAGGNTSNVAVDVTVSGGTATGGGVDYTFNPSTPNGNNVLNFPKNTTDPTDTFILTIAADKFDEGNETIVFLLSPRTPNQDIPEVYATVTIVDDDQAAVIATPTTLNAVEGNSSSYGLILNSVPSSTVSIQLNTNIHASLSVPGQNPGPGQPVTVSFPPGNAFITQTVTVTAYDDGIIEGDHTSPITHTVTSADPKYNPPLLVPTVILNITDDDAIPTIPLQTRSVAETAAAGPFGTPLTATINADSSPLGDWTIISGTPTTATTYFSLNSSTGQLSLTAAGAAALDFETLPITYTLMISVSDGINASDPTALTIGTLDVNDETPWVNPGQSFTLNENSPAGAFTTVNASDGDANPVFSSWTIITGTPPVSPTLDATAAFTISASSGQLFLTPAGAAGIDFETTPITYSLSISVSDGVFVSPSELFTITIADVNDPPIARSDSYTVTEDQILSVNSASAGVLANDYDADGDPISAFIDTLPANGNLFLNSNGTFSYDSNPDFFGTDSFTYHANDGVSNSAPVTVTIFVTGVNDPPVAVNDSYTVAEDTTLIATTSVLSNDIDVDNDPLTVSLRTGPTNGTLILIPDGTFTYTPTTDFAGTDSFIYNVSDVLGASSSATVTITVTNVNDAPILDLDANDSGGTVGINYTTTFTEDAGPVNLADNDLSIIDIDNINMASATVTITNILDTSFEVLTATVTGNISASYNGTSGVLTLNGSDSIANYRQVLRSVTYENSDNQPTTTDRIVQFTVSDGTSVSAAATTTVTVVAVNDPPIVDLDANDSGGTSGIDYAATYTEGSGSINITDSDLVITDSDSTTIAWATATITNLQDGAAEVLSASAASGVTVVYSPTTGVLTMSGVATLANYEGIMDSISYRNNSQAPTGSPARIVEIIVNDGTDSSIAAISTVTVVPVNDPPVNTVPANQTINEDTSLTFAGAISISTNDVDAGTASLTVIMTATNGTLTLSGTGGLSGVTGNGSGNVSFSGSQTNINSALNGMVFSPTLNFNGTAAVTISTNDQGNTGTGGAGIDTDSFNITVNPLPDPPAISGVGGTVISIGGTRVLLAPSAVITDVDLPANWNGYVLSVTIPLTAGLQISDTLVVSATTANSNPPTATGLSVRTRTPAGAVSDQIFYNGVHVGTIDSTLGGEGGEDLVVRFDQNAAQVESVMALIRAIAFSTTNSGISRTVTFTLIDPDSLSSNQPTVTVNIP